MKLLQIMVTETLLVSSVFFPALIGLKGAKHKDTEGVTNTRICFKRLNDDSYKVHISGHRCNVALARDIIGVALQHAGAAVEDPKTEVDVGPGKEEAVLDCKMFISETLRKRCN